MIQHNNIQLNVTAPKLNQTIVPFINLFGQLWFGQLKADVFVEKFVLTRHEILHSLVNLDQIQNKNSLFNLGWQLDLLHATRHVQKWNFPCLINQRNQTLDWTTGNKRLLCTAMNKKNPWQHLDVLILSDSESCEILSNPVLIKTDSQLQEILNCSDTVELETQLINHQNQVKLQLSYLGNLRQLKENKHMSIKKFVQWRQKYGPRPVLEIYTNWPELITDKNQAWQIKIMGDSEQIQKGIFRPGHLENNLRKDHARGLLPSTGNHRLLVVAPRPIDVGELLFWVNLESNIFIDHNWQFLLHRPDSMFENAFIGLSDLTTA